ncbi:MAG: acetyl-CoA carboxylase biotin carboxyl carrier protein [Verrucomicrobiales bacterium]|nr:acetyl-CoA carboxylase biotin carboxyl carrier protein [Verrucomicrobiales bacterium]
MDFKDIKKIVELMDEHGLSQFKLQQEDTKLELKRGGDIDVAAVQSLLAAAPAPQYQPMPAPAPAAAGSAPAAAAAPAEEGGLPAGVEEVASPMVGTFYTAASPDSDPFVSVGDKISADTTICIVEAMKVMNEIKAEISGEIVEVLVENGTAVQYGEPLFRVKTA